MELLYIHWNPDPILFSIAGIAIRWYSIFWFIAILAGSQVVYKLYQSKGLPVDTFQSLFLYSFLGIFIGARLGHCLFYEPDYYLSHPLEIVLPVRFYPDGDWKFTGYAGLASHGGTLGLIIALAIFCRKTKIHYLDILDMMGIAAPLAAGFIQLDEFRNYRFAYQYAVGFCIRACRYAPSSPGSVVRGYRLFSVFLDYGRGRSI